MVAKTKETKSISKYLKWLWEHCIKNRAAAWQAICAVVLSVFTILLYRVSDRATETSRASERAFINFSHLGSGVTLVAPGDGNWTGQEFDLNWINNLNTPANDIVIQANVQAWRSPALPLGYDFPENRQNALAVIGPKGTYGTIARVSKVDLMDAWQANSHIFFWGSVVYRDIFPDDPDRLSEFCVEMTHVTFAGSPQAINQAPPKTGVGQAIGQPTIAPTPAGVVAFQWEACREHNCYDQGCKDYSACVKAARAA